MFLVFGMSIFVYAGEKIGSIAFEPHVSMQWAFSKPCDSDCNLPTPLLDYQKYCTGRKCEFSDTVVTRSRREEK